MSDDLLLDRDGWFGPPDGDPESRALTRLRIAVAGVPVTRNVSKRGGGESEAITTSLLPLAEFLAASWWTLLHEPVRPIISDAFRVRHRLDSGMRGYAFPALALWSGGDGSVVADWATFANPHATISFLTPKPDDPVPLSRAAIEVDLLELIATVVERTGNGAPDLAAAWHRLCDTIADPDETAYCMAAGRLGLDPYNPDTVDLATIADGVPETLFNDASEIIEISSLEPTVDWLRMADARLKLFPETDIGFFGKPPVDDLGQRASVVGHDAAILLRARAGVPLDDPRRAVGDLFGGLIAEGGELDDSGPAGISAIVQRLGTSARIGSIARSARQRRFRACAAAYMAWTSTEGEERAATDATTRRQQAGRAFAAEMLAPTQALLGRASRSGFDDDDLMEIASDFICPYETVKWQSLRAGIPLRGIVIPPAQRGTVMTPAVGGMA